jgi:hypothetical protein
MTLTSGQQQIGPGDGRPCLMHARGENMEINGKPVINSKRKIMIEISPRDIKKGMTRDPGSCAAAQCLMRTVPGIKGARVHVKMTYIEFDDHWERLRTPPSLSREIVAFDRGAPFYPGQYNIGPLSKGEQERYGKAAGQGGGQDKTNRNKRRRPYHITEGIRERGANK